MQGVAEREALIEVGHDVAVGAEDLADHADRGEIVLDPLAPEAQLEAAKAAFGGQLLGLLGQTIERGQPRPLLL